VINSNPIHVAIVEDQPDIREMWRDLINLSDGVQCTHIYPDAESFLNDNSRQMVQVVLTDVNLPGMSGIELIAKVKPIQPSIHFIVCTVYEDDQKIFDALAAGATGYLLKSASTEKLVESIIEVKNGGSPMSLSVARRVVQFFSQPKLSTSADVLTTREKEILELLSQGLLYKEIAASLGISKGTVHIHIHNIYEKLQVSNRTEALNKAFRNK
jgi:DNA-binding NarL/FixJ family response regulator